MPGYHPNALANYYMFPSLTGIVIKLFYVALVAILAFIGGELLINTGVKAALVGGIVALIIEGLRTVVALRRQQLTAFSVVEEQSALLRAEERQFLQTQIAYLEAVELTTRKRMHAMTTETQRCLLHIRTCENIVKESASSIILPEFYSRTFEEITQAFPLPNSPQLPGG